MFSKLKKDHHELGIKYEAIRAETSAPLPQMIDIGTQQSHFLWRQRSNKDLGATIEDIRKKLPGYDRFLLSLTQRGLIKRASKGLHVVVNVTKFRSDAIIVSAKYGINVVSLPRFQEMDFRK
jgi:hypothetical protein